MLTPLVWGAGLVGDRAPCSVFGGNIKVSGRMLFVSEIGDCTRGDDVPNEIMSGSFFSSISGLINILENGDSLSVVSEISSCWCLADDLNPFGGEISMTSLSLGVLIVFLLL